jgi:LCP family protein required for cell wall assembly
MKDPAPSVRLRTTYRRPDSADEWNAPQHRRGATSDAPGAIRARRWPRRLLIAANVMVALTIIGAASAYGYVNWRFGQIHTKHLSALTTPHGTAASGGTSKPFTLLVVGSDSRAAIAAGGDNAQFGGTADVGGQRSDTIILVRVVPKTKQLMMLSIPRDLWGPIPGQGSNRINTAFDTGANLLIQTIQQDLHVPVNHYVELNFDTFRDISNAVGGISFYFPTPAKDAYSNLSIPAAGCYSLKGDQALAFVRSRHYEYYQNGYWQFEAASDLARIQRQQSFIKKMIKKAEGEYTNPFALNDIIGGITKNLTVDSGFSPSLMLTVAKDFRSMDTTTIPNLTLPTYGYTTSGGAEVLGLQEPQATQVLAAFNAFGAPAPAPAKTTPPTSTNTLPPVTVAPSRVSIEVANGTGTAGQAGQMTQVLAGLGYRASLASSPGYGHPTTVVRYAPDSLTAAQQVAAQIPGGATLVVAPDLTATAYNLEIVTGSSFTPPATSAASGSTSSSSTSATSTTLPGTNSETYVLPGATAGQPIPPC